MARMATWKRWAILKVRPRARWRCLPTTRCTGSWRRRAAGMPASASAPTGSFRNTRNITGMCSMLRYDAAWLREWYHEEAAVAGVPYTKLAGEGPFLIRREPGEFSLTQVTAVTPRLD